MSLQQLLDAERAARRSLEEQLKKIKKDHAAEIALLWDVLEKAGNEAEGIHLDITEQKKLLAELRNAKDALEASLKAKDIFLANVSHEMRTPMNAILGMSRQLQKTSIDEKQKGYITAINKAADSLLMIINELLDFSKMEAGKLTLEEIGFRFWEMIDNTVEMVRERAESKGLALEVTIDTAIADILIGDPYRLSQVLVNLLYNAIKFTEQGEVKIDCSLHRAGEMNQTIAISVMDTGIGMSPGFLKHLFDKFVQEDNSITRKYGGTGLGMSISKQLTELMKGEISVESEKYKGTTVQLRIPFAIGRISDIPVRENISYEKDILQNIKILVAEDNEMNREVATAVLEEYGAKVIPADNGKEAVILLQENEVDAILMDMQMPVMDGLEATRIIRTEMKRNIPIIALTANAIKGERQKCIDAGMDDFLVKPFDVGPLIGTLLKYIGKVKQAQNNIDIPVAANRNIPIASNLYNLTKMEELCKGNDVVVRKIVSVFVRESSLALTNIKAAFGSGDIETINRIAHRIKASLKDLGISSIDGDIVEMERFVLNGGNGDKLERHIQRVEEVIGRVNEDLRRY